MKLAYDFSKSLLLINRKLTRKTFLAKCGVKQHYSLNMFSRIFDSIFSELIDVDREFNKYYSFEYNSLESFLWKKYNLSTEQIETIIDERKKNPDCILFRKDDFSYGDYGIFQFAFSDVMFDRITNILKLMDTKNEN